MVNKLSPLAGPVDASGEPDASKAWFQSLLNAVIDDRRAESERLETVAGELRRCLSSLAAAALPSSPAQDLLDECVPRVLELLRAAGITEPDELKHMLEDRELALPSSPVTDRWTQIELDAAKWRARQRMQRMGISESSPVADSDEIDEEEVPHPFRSRTRYEPGDDRDIWCADCEYHRDYRVHTSAPSPSAGAAQESDIKKTTKL